MYKNRFKRFGGDHITDIIEYLKDYIKKDTGVTVSIGCDSIQKRRKTLYAITIMMYNGDLRNGAHVVFFRESCPKIRDINERLFKEAQYLHDLGVYLDGELSKFYQRYDLSDSERRRYKYHVLKCSGEYSHVPQHQEEAVMNALFLTTADMIDFRSVDIHVDFNPSEGSPNEKGVLRNKSYTAYKSYVPWLKGMGFRVWSKPLSFASTSAADLLLQD